MYQPYILKYDYSGLEPNISRKTLEAHYNNHYLKYLRQLNEVLKKNKFNFQYPVKDLFENIDIFPITDRDDILYNAGGVVNHELYFDNMNKEKIENIPEPLNSALINKFGSIDKFKQQFINLASILPGSGYTFLVVKKSGELYLINLANQDSPYSIEMEPILNIDVWEHAYYLDYGSNRKSYIEKFMKLIDYSKVNEKYKKILNQDKSF